MTDLGAEDIMAHFVYLVRRCGVLWRLLAGVDWKVYAEHAAEAVQVSEQ